MLNHSIRKFPVALLAIGLLLAFVAASANAAPSRTTEHAHGVDTATATLNATIVAEGHKTDYLFSWGTTPNQAEWTGESPIEVTESASPVKVSFQAKGLDAATTHYFAIATHDYVTEEIKSGETLSFTTQPFHPTNFVVGSGQTSSINATNKVEFHLQVGGGGGPLKITCLNEQLDAVGSSSTGVDSVSLTPKLKQCSSQAGFVEMLANSCTYVYKVDNTTAPFSGPFSISCPEGKKIEFKNSLCTIKLDSQTPGSSLSYTNESPGKSAFVKATGTVSNVAWTSTGVLCELDGSPASGNDGVIAISGPMGGRTGSEGRDLFVSDGKSEDGLVTSGGNFTAVAYPATVSGASVSGADLEIPSKLSITCATVTFSGILSAATNPLGLSSSYQPGGTCSSSFGNVTVKTNTCGPSLNLGGGTAIACTKEGDSLEVVASGVGITVKFLPSTGSALTYENLGSKNAATVRAKGSATGLKWTCAPTFTCGLGGLAPSGENGVMVVDATLKGNYSP